MDILRNSGYYHVFDYQNSYEAQVSGFEAFSRRRRVFYVETEALDDSVSASTSKVKLIVTVTHPDYSPRVLQSLIINPDYISVE